MNLNNITTLEMYSQNNPTIYLYDLCKTFEQDYNFLVIKFLIIIIIIFLLYSILNYFNNKYTNKKLKFIFDRIEFLNINIGMVISLILLWRITNINYTIQQELITIVSFIISILIIIRYFGEKIWTKIKLIRKNLKMKHKD